MSGVLDCQFMIFPRSVVLIKYVVLLGAGMNLVLSKQLHVISASYKRHKKSLSGLSFELLRSSLLEEYYAYGLSH